jgi:ABC-type transporter Mla MlaB component
MSDNDTRVIDCGDALGIAQLADMYTKLLSGLAEGHDIQFNVSNIERIDAASLQMICAFSKEVKKAGHILSWQGASEAFVRSVNILGLATLINMEDNAQ